MSRGWQNEAAGKAKTASGMASAATGRRATGADGMPELAARLGVTERHLRRVFAQAHGVSPMDYLTTQRLLQAKQLLTDTDLPVTEVAFACGFESLRRFNAVFAEQVRLKPTELRSAARTSPAAGHGLRVRLGYRPPYDSASMALRAFSRAWRMPSTRSVRPTVSISASQTAPMP